MEQATASERTTPRKLYQKPVLEIVRLRPEEAVLGACKVASGSGPAGACGISCQTFGS